MSGELPPIESGDYNPDQMEFPIPEADSTIIHEGQLAIDGIFESLDQEAS